MLKQKVKSITRENLVCLKCLCGLINHINTFTWVKTKRKVWVRLWLSRLSISSIPSSYSLHVEGQDTEPQIAPNGRSIGARMCWFPFLMGRLAPCYQCVMNGWMLTCESSGWKTTKALSKCWSIYHEAKQGRLHFLSCEDMSLGKRSDTRSC